MGKSRVWEACPKSPQEFEVHPEIKAGSPAALPVLSHPKALAIHVTSSPHHCPGAAVVYGMQERFGSGANTANMAASESASVGCFLVWGETAGGRGESGGGKLFHQRTLAFTWRG